MKRRKSSDAPPPSSAGRSSAAPDWSPATYLNFTDLRLRPALDLLARIENSPRRIVDLGCGGGGPTLQLARRWPQAHILAIDQSPAMLAEAQALGREAGRTDIVWQQGDIAAYRPTSEPPDLIFSNACLHWLADHEVLIPRLMSYLSVGGCLAVQMPLSWQQPSHRLMREVLADLGLSDAVPGLHRRPVGEPADYLRRLRPISARVEVWTTTYQQLLTGDDAVFRWVESTGLRPVRAVLDGEPWQRFEDEYRRRLRLAYPGESDSATIFPFTRLYLVASRAA